MAGPDSVVVVPSVIGGINIDNAQYTDASGTVVNRQRVDVPAPIWAASDVLTAILVELRLHNILFAMAFNITDDLNCLRNDITTETETQ